MGQRQQSALALKVKQQSAERTFAERMKSASDNQFKGDQQYHVIPKDSENGVSLRMMTLEEFTAWAGRAARLYKLVPV